MAIKAPFNFVPVSDKVYFPDWADKISHDIPFSDGISGTIDLTITAESPIFVRNGHTEQDRQANSDAFKSFSNIDGKYFIPGTSLKGSIRNVMEIMSFGKMRVDKKMKFAQREWDKPALYPMKGQQSNLLCGWLRRDGDKYKIIDCGKPYRIGHSRIDEWLGEDVFRNNFSKYAVIDLNKDIKIENKTFDPKSAEYKYYLLRDKNLNNLSFTTDNEFATNYSSNRVRYDSNGDIKGTLVLTGQPDRWMWPRPETLTRGAGKFYEFVFGDKVISEHKLDKLEFDHFKFIYSESTEWNRIRKAIESEQGVPVFFRMENKKIKDFGIAFLYKLPYDNSPYDTLSKEHKDENSIDLAECIFGTENKDKPLKGRVQFGNAICIEGERDNDLIFTMGSPKASYYPIYIEQPDGNKGNVSNYKTYNDSKIKGWKRYQIRDSIFGNKPIGEYNKTLDTWLIPLAKGAKFKSKVKFHNLKPIELAALYSALTFHNTTGCKHQLGQGKPFGLGKVSIELNHNLDIDLEMLLAKYEEAINNKLNISWNYDTSIIELITLAKLPIVNAENALFSYMKMDTNRVNNEFLTAKENNEFLQYYTALKKQKETVNTYYSKYREKIEKEIKEKEIEEKTKREEQERIRLSEEFKKIVVKANEAFTNEDYETALKIFESALEIMPEDTYCLNKSSDLKDIILKQKQEERLESGLSFLDEKVDFGPKEGEYKVADFKGVNNRIKDWFKKTKTNTIPENDFEILFSTLKRVYESANKRELKNWEQFDKGNWRIISSWVGNEITKKWFEEIVVK